jgi:Flp pilus assembly pilin Flp
MNWSDVRRRFRVQFGQGMVEYSLILVLVAIVVVMILLATGNQFKNLYSDILVSLSSATM